MNKNILTLMFATLLMSSSVSNVVAKEFFGNGFSEEDCSIFGFNPNTLKQFMVPSKFFYVPGFWGNYFGYKPVSIEVNTLKDYLLAKSRIENNIKKVKDCEKSVSDKSFFVGAVSLLEPELQVQLDKCNLMRSQDAKTFKLCNEISRQIALKALNTTFDDMNKEVEEAEKKRLEITADTESVIKYENKYEGMKKRMHEAVTKLDENAQHYYETNERIDSPDLQELSKEMQEYLKPKQA